jgi:hypothetical protein
MTVASEIGLPKWQAGRPGCQNGRQSKSCAKQSAKLAKRFFRVWHEIIFGFFLLTLDSGTV